MSIFLTSITKKRAETIYEQRAAMPGRFLKI